MANTKKNTMLNDEKVLFLFAETEEQKEVDAIYQKIDEATKQKTIVKYPKIKKFNICSNSYVNSNGKIIKAYTISFFPLMPDDFYKSLLGRYQKAENCIVNGLNKGYKGMFDSPFYDHTFNGVRCIAMKPSYVNENYDDAMRFFLTLAEKALKCTNKDAITFTDMTKLHAKARTEIENAKKQAEKEKRLNLEKDLETRFTYLQFEAE